VEAGRRDEGAQPGEEFLGGHVGVGDTAAPGGLEQRLAAARMTWRSPRRPPLAPTDVTLAASLRQQAEEWYRDAGGA